MNAIASAAQKMNSDTNNGPRRARRNRTWGRSRQTKRLSWSHDMFGSIDIETGRLPLGDVSQAGPTTWAPINLLSKTPHKVELFFVSDPHKDVTLIYVKGDESADVTSDGLPSFAVNVEWDENAKPHTRKTEKDNFDLVFLKDSGLFVIIEVSVVTRGGLFYLVVQEVYGGQIVNGHNGLKVNPLTPENNFPGADFMTNFAKTGAAIMKYAPGVCNIEDADEAPLWEADWNPNWGPKIPEDMDKVGWVRGVTTFFNVVIGYGFVLCEDGKTAFVHFANIHDGLGRPLAARDEFPLLQPMAPVMVKYKEEGGKRKATAVRVVDA
jgi:cold shock CspA family protein